MVEYIVTTRNAKGLREERAYTAENRSDLFKKLTADKITAVRVREGSLVKKARTSSAIGNVLSKYHFFIIAAVILTIVCCVLWVLILRKNDDKKNDLKQEDVINVGTPISQVEPHTAKVVRIRREFNTTVKDYIKKTPGTNKIEWVIAPLDPDDPDNALRTAIAKDIGSLLSIVPGERIPPIIPFSFMFEDDAIESAVSRGESVVSFDGGNRRFLEELKKWKVTIKDGDSEARVAAKKGLIDVQLELLKNIDEGISVNDSIRAAYEFRIKAAEVRSDMIAGLKEVHASDPDIAVTKEMIATANKQLEEEGILLIQEEDIFSEEELGN